MRARIYKPTKNAMQSGKARTKLWLLEYEPETARVPDPLMGWTSSNDMRQQLALEFDTREEAIAYAQKHEGVWFARCDQLARWALQNNKSAA